MAFFDDDDSDGLQSPDTASSVATLSTLNAKLSEELSSAPTLLRVDDTKVMEYYPLTSTKYLANRSDDLTKTKFAVESKGKLPPMNQPMSFDPMSENRRKSILYLEASCVSVLRGAAHIPFLFGAQLIDKQLHVYMIFEGDDKYKSPVKTRRIEGDIVTKLMSQVKAYRPPHPTVVSHMIPKLIHLLAYRFETVEFIDEDETNSMTAANLFASCTRDNPPLFHFMVLQRHPKPTRVRIDKLLLSVNPNHSKHDEDDEREHKKQYCLNIDSSQFEVDTHPAHNTNFGNNHWVTNGRGIYFELERFVRWGDKLQNADRTTIPSKITFADYMFEYFHDYTNDVVHVPDEYYKKPPIKASRFISNAASVSKKGRSQKCERYEDSNSEDDDDYESENDEEDEDEEEEDDEDEDEEEEDDEDEDEEEDDEEDEGMGEESDGDKDEEKNVSTDAPPFDEAVEIDLSARKKMSKVERALAQRSEAALAKQYGRQLEKQRNKRLAQELAFKRKICTTKRTSGNDSKATKKQKRGKITFLPEGASEEEDEVSDEAQDEVSDDDEYSLQRVKRKKSLSLEKQRNPSTKNFDTKPLPLPSQMYIESFMQTFNEDVSKACLRLQNSLVEAATVNIPDNK